MEIKTKRLRLVPLGMKYLDSTHEYASDMENARYMVYLPKRDLAETKEFLAGADAQWKKKQPSFYEFAVLRNESHIGAVSIYPDEKRETGEVGWIINKKFWGQGFAAEAADGLIRYFHEVMGMNRFVAHCDSENIASQKVMQKLNFVQVAEYGGRKNRASEDERMEKMYERMFDKNGRYADSVPYAALCKDMLQTRTATENDYINVREFYYCVTDALKDMEYAPGWEKDVYPTQEFLRQSIEKNELYVGEVGGQILACMVVNHEYNEGYREISWSVEAEDAELLVIHALGVHPKFSGRGIAKKMVQRVIGLAEANEIRTIRLDVLEGNLPAEQAYTKLGFVYVDTVRMFYEDTGWTNYRLFEYSLIGRA